MEQTANVEKEKEFAQPTAPDVLEVKQPFDNHCLTQISLEALKFQAVVKEALGKDRPFIFALDEAASM